MEETIHISYRNITISGRAASGATTLSRSLSHTLGWTLINGGEMVRKYVKEKNIPLEKTTETPDEYHRDLDQFIKDKLRNEANIIVESWLAGFDAQGIKGTFKIFVDCPVDGVRIDRLVNRENMTIEEAKTHIRIREEENIKKWEALYLTRDFWNPALYDLVIDTYQNGPQQTLELALEKLQTKSQGENK